MSLTRIFCLKHQYLCANALVFPAHPVKVNQRGGELMVTLSRHKYKETAMRRLALTLLATTAAIGLAASAATAADLPRKAPAYVPPPPPAWNWTGLYLGGNLGVGISRDQFNQGACSGNYHDAICTDVYNLSEFGASLNMGSHNELGFVGGLQLGYNWQFANSPFVVGIEGGYRWADMQGDHQNYFQNTSAGLTQGVERITTKTDGLAHIVGKLGLASGPQDRTLWYVVGGGAWRHTKIGTTVDFSQKYGTEWVGAFSGKADNWGWTVGTGVEWGLFDNWSAKIEYDYMDFGNKGVSVPGSMCSEGSCQGISRTINLKQQVHLVTVGLNYRFNWGR
jgi:outer membrane immunogenic protein